MGILEICLSTFEGYIKSLARVGEGVEFKSSLVY